MARQRTKERQHGGRPSGGVRPFWSGTITFGLVSVPVDLYPASRHVGASFRMLDQEGTPLARRYACPVHERTIHPEHIVRGYPIDDDDHVIVRDDELRSLQPRKSRDIDLRQFVDRSEVPPLFFERAYFLTPAGDSTKAYRLLTEVMQETGRAGIASFVMRDKEYLVAILAESGVLRAETLRFHDEIRSPQDVGLPEPTAVAPSLVSKFRKAIQARHQDHLNDSDMEDRADKQLRELAQRKWQQGVDVVDAREAADTEQREPDEAPAVDLIETIRRKLQQGGDGDGKANGRSISNGRPSDGSGSRDTPNRDGAGDDLANQSKQELYEQAQTLKIPGRSRMTKQQLLRAIKNSDRP